jgi:predicted nucleic acid-binding protein
MSSVVIDASVFIATVMPDKLSEQAEHLIRRLDSTSTALHAPTLLRYEMVAVARKVVHQKRFSAEKGRSISEELFAYPVTLHFDDGLLLRAYELAEEFAQPSAYDAQYMALAERLACEFWTADERLFNSVRSQFPSIRWLGALRGES